MVFDLFSVVSASQQNCHINRVVDIATDGTPSFIGNVVTEESGCGGADNPWILKAKRGQRINITMMDFGVGLRDQQTLAEDAYTPKICRSVPRNNFICQGLLCQSVYGSSLGTKSLKCIHGQVD